MNKRIGLIVFVIVFLFLPLKSFTSDLHFGIISAVEKKIHELKAKKGKEQTYEIKRNFTDTSGQTMIHSGLLGEDIYIVTQDADTGQPVSGVTINFYTNKEVIIITAIDPQSRYFPTPHLSSLVESTSEIQNSQMTQSSSGIADIVLKLPPVIETIYDFGKEFLLLTPGVIAYLPGSTYLGSASLAEVY